MSRAKPKSQRAGPEPRSVRLGAAWAAALLALLVLVFFHEVTLGGKTFVAPDATAPVGFVRVGEQSLYGERVYPLWNPYVFLGMPSFGSGAYNPLIYPPDWPLALLNRLVPLPELTWLLLYYFLGGLFLFLLAREWGARPEGALLGAAAFVFAPNLVAVGSHGHGSQLVNSAYLPMLLWLATRWMRRGGLHHLGWLALAGGFQMLRGHAQIVFYTWLAIALYLAVEVVAGLRRAADDGPPLGLRLARAAGIGVAVALAFGVAGFYNLPLRDYARFSIRGGGADGGVGMDYATSWSLALRELPTMVVPGWAGFGGETYWGGMPFTDYPNIYVGMVVVVISLAGWRTLGPARIFALLLGAFSLMVALGKHSPLYQFLYDHLPLFNKFRVPVMAIVLFQVTAALGLAWGWTWFLEPRAAPRGRAAADRTLVVAAGALALALLVGVVGQDVWRAGYVALVEQHRPEMAVHAAEAAFRGFVGDLGRVALLGLAALALAALALRQKMGAALASLALLGLLLIELWPVSRAVMAPVIGPRTPGVLDQGRDDVVAFLEQAGPPGSFRVLPLAEFQSNRLAGFAVASLGGYHAAKPRLFQDLLESGALQTPEWMRLLNVRYLVSARPIEAPGLGLAYQGSAHVYEMAGSLPRATVVGSYRVAPAARAIVDSIAAGTRDPATTTWLERDPGLGLGPVEGARAEIVRYGLNDVAIEVESPGPALLRLADLWYPDWVATVDGRPAPVLRADYLLRAVEVPAGRHRVEFHFRSAAVRDGLLLSLASLLAVAGLFAVAWWRRRRRPSPVEAA